MFKAYAQVMLLEYLGYETSGTNENSSVRFKYITSKDTKHNLDFSFKKHYKIMLRHICHACYCIQEDTQ
jgi:hypothetical protein